MPNHRHSQQEDVEQLLLNAQLRDEIEPYMDESVHCIQLQQLPTNIENEYLKSMLAWERAPVLSISRWFAPELKVPHPDSLTDQQLHQELWDAIHQLFQKRIVLDFTDHLSDRQLYTLIWRDLLQTEERQVDLENHTLHWDCANVTNDPSVWLSYYATAEERDLWINEEGNELGETLPPQMKPPYPRELPRLPL